jgi:hypothetical protein
VVRREFFILAIGLGVVPGMKRMEVLCASSISPRLLQVSVFSVDSGWLYDAK